MDQFLAAWMDRVIRQAQRANELRPVSRLKPSGKLRLLFAGYNGTRNTGADVRVEEILRQVRHLFGEDRLELTVFSFIKSYSKGYFGNARQVTPGVLFPNYLSREVPRHDGVIACEGSTFKSAFTDLLTVMMVGAMGLATAHNRLSVAYGAEAGHMNPWPRRLAADHCKDSLVITRNEESRRVLAELDIPSEFGTDTAWTFSPLGDDYARRELRKAGWNGERILLVCPINPFWWPVKASLSKTAWRMLGFYRDSHYGRIFFHHNDDDVKQRFEKYLSAVAGAVKRFREKTGVFVAVAASEELDNRAVKRLAEKLGGAATFSSTNYNMYQLVSIFRAADMMLSSRYHAILTSMPGRVASAGISFDERIANLMRDRGHEHLLMRVDDPDLQANAEAALDYLNENTEAVAEEASRTVAKHLRIMSDMGRKLVEYVVQKHPQFEPRRRLDSWEDYLPPLGAELHELLGEHAHMV
jgi:polysaccharide pyruvyl transferase WcaK-like protein